MPTRAQQRTKRHLTEARDTNISCILCHGETSTPTNPSQWKSDGACMYALALNVPMDGSVCPACRKDITKVLLNSEHVPRWKKTSSVSERCVHGYKCIILQDNQRSHRANFQIL